MPEKVLNFKTFLSSPEPVNGLTKQELQLTAITEIVNELIRLNNENKDVNLNKLKAEISKKYALDQSPRLTDIIAAVPHEYKKILLPKLRAKPIRTASGIAVVAVMCKPHRCPHINFTGNICIYCAGSLTTAFRLRVC